MYRGVLSLFFQLVMTPLVLKRFGVGVSILFLPVSLLLGSSILALYPVLWAAILLKVSDGSFRFSIHRSGIELLYLPIPLKVKNQVKGFIDIFIDRFGLGVGGLLLLLCTSFLALSIRQLSLIVCGMASIWIALSLVIRREYLNSFRLALEKKIIEPEDLRIRISDNAILESLTRALESPDERSCSMLSGSWLIPVLSPGLTKFRICSSTPQPECALWPFSPWPAGHHQESESELSVECLKDPDLEVRSEVIHYLCGEENSHRLDRDLTVSPSSGLFHRRRRDSLHGQVSDSQP